MIQSKSYDLILKKVYSKVLACYPTSNQKFLLLASRSPDINLLVHLSKQGTILWEHVFKHSVDQVTLMTPHSGCALLTRQGAIEYFELEDHTTKRVPFDFMFEQTERSSLFSFSITKLICIADHGPYGQHMLRLTYFKFPQLEKPVFVYESKQRQWVFSNHIRRADNSSQVLWYKSFQAEGPQFYLSEVSLNKKSGQWQGRVQLISMKTSLASLENVMSLSYNILSIWKASDHRFLLNALTDREKMRDPLERPSKLWYLLDRATLTVRQIRMPLPFEQLETICVSVYLGDFCMLCPFAFKEGQSKTRPMYYLQGRSGEIVGQQEWQCSHMFKFTTPGYNGSMLVVAQYDNAEVNSIEVSIKTVYEPVILALHMLLQLCPDFDDDLLQEATQFLRP